MSTPESEIINQRSYVVETATSPWDVSSKHFSELPPAIEFAQKQKAANGPHSEILVHLLDTSTIELFRAPGFLDLPGLAVVGDRARDYRQRFVATRKDGEVVWESKCKSFLEAREQAFGLIGTRSYNGAPVLAILYQRANADCLLRLGGGVPQWYPEVLRSPKLPAPHRPPEGPIVGFRCWRVAASSVVPGQSVQLNRQQPEYSVNLSVLRSLHVTNRDAPSGTWASPRVLFGCSLGHHLPEDAGHSHHCGLYAFTHLDDAIWEMEGVTAEDPTVAVVIGVISGHGDVLVHNSGWRAEEAHILGFLDTDRGCSLPELRQHVSGQFDVPLLSQDKIQEFALRQGRVIHKRDIPDLEPTPKRWGEPIGLL